MEYSIVLINNHIILTEDDKKYLIDTGSPISISSGNTINIFGNTYPTEKFYHNENIHGLSSYVGCDLFALIGMDILRDIIFKIDLSDKIFYIFNDFEETIMNKNNHAKLKNGLLKISIGSNEVEAIIDTGAKISYASRDLLSGYESFKSQNDFFPNFGEFITPVYEISTKIFNEYVPFSFGVLPQLPTDLESQLLSGQFRAIIGSDIFSHYSLVFSYNQGKIYFEKTF